MRIISIRAAYRAARRALERCAGQSNDHVDTCAVVRKRLDPVSRRLVASGTLKQRFERACYRASQIATEALA